VPLWSALGANEAQREVLDILSGDVAVGRPILTAPGVPADRVDALRKAFDDTLRDPQFMTAANQANVYINPMGGAELQAIVQKIASPSQAIATILKQATALTDLQSARP
jgi:tripartite-type tricarboxylate transporter receptor subunit TctC